MTPRESREFTNVIRQAHGMKPIGPKAGKRNRQKSKRDPRRRAAK